MKRTLLIAVIIPIALAMACSSSDDNPSSTTPAGGDNTAVTPSPAGPTVAATDVCKPNPAPGTPQTIQVDQPAPLSRHERTLTVSGKIAAFEAVYKIRIYDAKGAVLVGATGMTAEGQVLSPFTQDLTLDVAGEQPACLWVYEESARDGSPTNVAQVPIVVAP